MRGQALAEAGAGPRRARRGCTCDSDNIFQIRQLAVSSIDRAVILPNSCKLRA